MVILVAGLFGCGGSESPCVPSAAQDKLKLPIGSFAPPSPNQTLSGDVVIGGWAIHESGIESVRVYVDRDYQSTANVGLDRPDVAKVYPSFPKKAISGWNALLTTGALSAGPHEIVARVRANDGSQHDFVVPVVIAQSSKP